MIDILISIIIPHKNDICGLEKLIESVKGIEQTEVIVVDDCSNISIKERFIHLHPDVIFVENNSKLSGAGAARNIGLDISKGKYLVFCDSDDLINRYEFEKLLAILRSSHSDLILFPPTSRRKDGLLGERHLRYAKLVNSKKITAKEAALRFVVPWSKAVKKSLVQDSDIKFDTTPVSNDVMFSCKCALYAQKIECSDIPYYIVTESDSGLTKKMDKFSLITRISILNRYNHCLINNNEVNSVNLKYIPLLRMVKRYPFTSIKYIFKYFDVMYRYQLKRWEKSK